MSSLVFVGFGSEASWLEALERSKPVNVEVITDPGRPGKFGITSMKTAVVLSQVRGTEVLYLSVPVGRYSAIDGRPMNEGGHLAYLKRAESALDVVKHWLTEHNVPFRLCLVAAPRSLKMLDGYLSFMHYEKGSDLYVLRVDPEPAVVPAPAGGSDG